MTIETKPKWNEKILLNEIKEGIRHQKLICRKDFLEQCVRRTLCPSEIMAVAKRVVNTNHERNRKEEKRILQMRIDEMKREIAISKEKWTAETMRVNSILKLSPEGSRRMRMIRESELKQVWNREKERVNKKADLMDNKQNPMRNSKIPALYRDIPIGDVELIDKYGDTIPSVAIHGRIEASENVIKFYNSRQN